MKEKIYYVLMVLLIVVLLVGYNIFSKKEKSDETVLPEESSYVMEEVSEEVSTVQSEKEERIEFEGKPTIHIVDVRGKAGEQITVDVAIANNPGILGMSMSITYDESVINLIDVENGPAFKDVLEMTHSENLKSGCQFLWDGEDVSENQIQDGAILKLKFEIVDTAPTGKTPVVITLDIDGAVDNTLKVIDLSAQKGFVIITD